MEKEKELLDNEKPIHEVLVNYETYLNRRLKPSSLKVYMSAIKKYFNEGNKIDSAEDYSNFIFAYVYKKRSSHYYDIIIKFVNFLNLEKDTKKLITTTLKNIRKKYHDPVKKTLILHRDQRMNIIYNLNSYKHQVIGVIQEECGVRAGDVLRLKRGAIDYDVDDNEVIMSITFQGKGDKVRKVLIYNKESIQFIQQFIRTKLLHSEYYFIETKNVRNKHDFQTVLERNYDLYYHDLQKTCRKLSYEPSQFTSHDIRRNYAVEMLPIVNNNIVELQKLMGHASVETTAIYLRNSGYDTKDYQKKRTINNLNNY